MISYVIKSTWLKWGCLVLWLCVLCKQERRMAQQLQRTARSQEKKQMLPHVVGRCHGVHIHTLLIAVLLAPLLFCKMGSLKQQYLPSKNNSAYFNEDRRGPVWSCHIQNKVNSPSCFQMLQRWNFLISAVTSHFPHCFAIQLNYR